MQFDKKNPLAAETMKQKAAVAQKKIVTVKRSIII